MTASDNKKIDDKINEENSQPNKVINNLERKIEHLSNKGIKKLEDKSSTHTIKNNLKAIRNHFESKGYKITFVCDTLYISWD
jgi:low affinity Fe/Cu permease